MSSLKTYAKCHHFVILFAAFVICSPVKWKWADFSFVDIAETIKSDVCCAFGNILKRFLSQIIWTLQTLLVCQCQLCCCAKTTYGSKHSEWVDRRVIDDECSAACLQWWCPLFSCGQIFVDIWRNICTQLAMPKTDTGTFHQGKARKQFLKLRQKMGRVCFERFQK